MGSLKAVTELFLLTHWQKFGVGESCCLVPSSPWWSKQPWYHGAHRRSGGFSIVGSFKGSFLRQSAVNLLFLQYSYPWEYISSAQQKKKKTALEYIMCLCCCIVFIYSVISVDVLIQKRWENRVHYFCSCGVILKTKTNNVLYLSRDKIFLWIDSDLLFV